MKIAGFTIIKNAVTNDFPILEAIKAILPVVDEMIVLIGDSNDETIALIESIGDPKIKIHHSVWDKNLRKGGSVLAVETNKAFQLIDDSFTWAFYIQGDEVVHEKYHSNILTACEKYAKDEAVQGLLFRYKHFFGTYDYVGDSRKWYAHETRIIRNNKAISAYKDAQGFRIGRSKLPVAAIDASIYHYGWVKDPRAMQAKQTSFHKLWHDDEWLEQNIEDVEFFPYEEHINGLARFKGTHPQIMQARIDRLNWTFKVEPSRNRKSLKNKLKDLLKFIGIDTNYRNYNQIR